MTKLIAYTTTTALAFAGALLAASNASAQERCKISWETPAADTKYTQQLSLDVGDIPGHQVRVFELHRVYRNDKPNCEGLKRTEGWTRGYSDFIDRNGRAWGYAVVTPKRRVLGGWLRLKWIRPPDISATGLIANKLRQAGQREGRYLLRTNLTEADPAKLWELYLRLVAVEQAFNNLKDDLAIRADFSSARDTN